MTSDEKLAMLFRIVGKIELRLDSIEGNQRNAESGTTACSAAGGGIEQVKTARSASREPRSIGGLVLALDKIADQLCEPIEGLEIEDSYFTRLELLTIRAKLRRIEAGR